MESADRLPAFAALFCATISLASAQITAPKAFSGPCTASAEQLAGPRYQVSGRVIDDLTEEPLAGVTVQLSSICRLADDSGVQQASVTAEAVTSRDGHFRFDNVPAIGIRLDATKQDYAPPWTFRRRADDPIGMYSAGPGSRPIDLRLMPLASISGVVRDDRGEPLRGAWVTLESARPWAGWRGLQYGNSIQTGPDGSWRFSALTPGDYYVVAQPWLARYGRPERNANGNATGYVPQRYPERTANETDSMLHLRAGEQLTADIQLRREILHHVDAAITGGSKFANIVEVVDANGSKAYLTSEPGSASRFEAWVPRGSYRLESQFSSADGEFQASLPFDVADADLSGLTFAVAHATEIRIPIEIVSVAPADASCCCIPTDTACGFWYLQAVHMLPNGSFESGPQSTQSRNMTHATPAQETISLRPGSYFLAALTMGNAYAKSVVSGSIDLTHEPLILNAGRTPEPIRIVMAEAASVEGAVKAAGGSARAWIYALPDDPDTRLFQPILSQPDGHFQIPGLPPGGYVFFATDEELSLDLRDAQALTPWRAPGTAVVLKPGKNTPVALNLTRIADIRN